MICLFFILEYAVGVLILSESEPFSNNNIIHTAFNNMYSEYTSLAVILIIQVTSLF